MQHPHTDCASRDRKSCSGGKIRTRQAGEAVLILGAIIAGGRSSRFGSDKAVAMLDGRRLIDHAADLLTPHVVGLVVVGRSDDGVHSMPDLPRAGLGPLGGIAAALDHAASAGFSSVLTIGCDMPRVPVETLEALLEQCPAYCVDAPILGHWSAALGAHLLAHIESAPDRSIRRWAQAVDARPLATARIANVNTVEELSAL